MIAKFPLFSNEKETSRRINFVKLGKDLKKV